MTTAQKWKLTTERLARERLAARTPEQVAADKKASADHLAALAGRVTRLGGGVLEGSPADLKEICRMFGFANPCRDGRVYLTAPKMALLFAGKAGSQ